MAGSLKRDFQIGQIGVGLDPEDDQDRREGPTLLALNADLRAQQLGRTGRKPAKPAAVLPITAAVGKGQINKPADAARARRALALMGTYPKKQALADLARQPRSATDLMPAIRTFQQQHGLTVDGIMKPGGETQRHFALLLEAKVAKEVGEAFDRPNPFKAKPNPTIARTWPDIPTRISVPFGSGMGMDTDATDHMLATAAANDIVIHDGVADSEFAIARDDDPFDGSRTMEYRRDRDGAPQIVELAERGEAAAAESDGAIEGGTRGDRLRTSSNGNDSDAKDSGPTSDEQAPPIQLAQASIAPPTPDTGQSQSSAPGTGQAKAAQTNADVDLAFIHDLEGKMRSDMYVPTDSNTGLVFGKSGPTISAGVDIGQMNQHDLDQLVKNHGLSKSLAKKLSPYLGLKKQAAVAFVAKNPLTISAAEAKELANAKYSEIRDRLEASFDAEQKRLGLSKTFATIPRKVRTVILSVAIQHGSNLAKVTPRFWGHAIRGNQTAMEHELRNFGPNYTDRREIEANYLVGKPIP